MCGIDLILKYIVRLCTGAQIPLASQLINASTTVLFPTAIGCCVWTQGMSVGVAVMAVCFLIAHLVLVVQSCYAQIEKQTGRVVKSGGLLAVTLHLFWYRNYDGCQYG